MAESVLNEIGHTTNFTDSEMLTASIWIMLLVLLPAIIVSWIGLFKLKNWARWVYLITSCSGYLIAISIADLTKGL